MEDIELYINDHFPFRDEIVGIKGSIEKLIGKKVQNGIYLGNNEYMMKEYHPYSTQMMTNHTMRINDFADNTDVNIYFMLTPTSNLIMGAEK